ncbi:MAG: small multi-drug export protein [Desulfotignum sp.]
MKNSIFKTIEGRLLMAGLLMALLLVGTIGFYLATDRAIAKTLILTFFANTFGGRSVGIGLCIIQDLSAFPTIFYNFYLEVMVTLFTYSVFALTTINYLRVEWVIRAMERIAETAVKQKKKIERFGWIGLFVFVMIPLPVTGPVVGSIIGGMIRIGLVKNFSATFLGTLTAIVLWFEFFEFLDERFQVIQYFFAVIVILVLIPYIKKIRRFVQTLRQKKQDP